jgi:hypothetical protein
MSRFLSNPNKWAKRDKQLRLQNRTFFFDQEDYLDIDEKMTGEEDMFDEDFYNMEGEELIVDPTPSTLSEGMSYVC